MVEADRPFFPGALVWSHRPPESFTGDYIRTADCLKGCILHAACARHRGYALAACDDAKVPTAV